MQLSLNIGPGIAGSPTSIRINREDKHLLKSLQRKCYSRQIDDGKEIPNNLLQLLSDLSQKTSQPPLYNFSLLNYCRKKINLQLVQPSDFPSFIHEIKPRQLELRNGKSAVDIIKGQSEFERTQAYEVVRPFVVFGRNQKLVDCMLPAIAALANEQDGGFIMIAEAYSGSVVKTGFPPLDPKLVEQVLNNSLQRIYHHKNIQLKVETLPIYQNVMQVLQEQKSIPKQFIIRVTVIPQPYSKDFFWVENKISGLKQGSYTFFSIASVKQPCDELFRVSQVKDHQIYFLMQNVAMKRLKFRTLITKNKNFTSGVSFPATKKNLEPQHFCNILTKLSKTDFNRTLKDFKKNRKQKWSVVQVQMSHKFDYTRTLQKMTSLLDLLQVQYQSMIPLQDFQTDLLKESKKEKAKEKAKRTGSVIAYFFLDRKFDEFQEDVQEKFGKQYNDRVVMTEVTNEVNLKQLYPNQTQAIQNFLWQFFESIPKLKKEVELKDDKSEVLKFKNLKFIFGQQQFNIAIFTYFFLALGQKKPQSVQVKGK